MKDLEIKAKEVRNDVIDMIYNAGSGHPGSSLSCIDLLVLLYHDIMNLKENKNGYSFDRFVLSKGHAAPALYAVLSQVGYIEKERLNTLRKIDSVLQGHPTNKIKGIDVCTGSLGQGLSIANGMAIAKKIDKEEGNIYCLLGDGELEEGQIWEALMTANKYNLNNLIVFVDNNNLQIDGEVSFVKDIYPLDKKFLAFGFNVYKADGHNMQDMKNKIIKAKKNKAKPSIIILKTIKGKGISFMENEAIWHGKKIEEEDYIKAKKELEGVI